MEDSRIIDLFFAREEQAITELMNAHGAAAARVAGNILNNPQDAEECVSDACLAAWNTIPPRRPDPLRTYLCKITRNLALKRYHANTAAKRGGGYALALEELEEVLPARGNVEADYIVRELSSAVGTFLDTLDYDDRFMFVRRYWYADSVKDIAAMMHLGAHRVSVRLSRIRKRLQAYLKKEGLLA